MLSLLEAVEWCLRWKLLKGLAVIVGPLEVVFVSAWYLKLMALAMIVDCLWQVIHWNLVEKLDAVEALEEPLPGLF